MLHSSIGGALCNQQVSIGTRIKGHQYGKGYGANAVGLGYFSDVWDLANYSFRERIYAEGGILSVTSRILVVDLLSSMLSAYSCWVPC